MATEKSINIEAGPLTSAGQWLQRWSDWILGVGVLGLILTLISPIAPWFLDVLLALNIAGSVLQIGRAHV